MTGHTGDGVIHNNNGGIGFVIGCIDQAGNAGVHKGGVANDCHSLSAACLGEAVQTGNGSAHADGGIQRCQRRHSAQRIAADVTKGRNLVFGQRVVQASVGTAGAHHGRTSRNYIFHLGAIHRDFQTQQTGDLVLRELINAGEFVLANQAKAHVSAVIFNEAVQFFHHAQLAD